MHVAPLPHFGVYPLPPLLLPLVPLLRPLYHWRQADAVFVRPLLILLVVPGSPTFTSTVTIMEQCPFLSCISSCPTMYPAVTPLTQLGSAYTASIRDGVLPSGAG